MHTGRTLLAFFLIATVGQAADIFPIKGDPIKGDVVSISDKDIVYKQGDKQVTRSIKEILKIDYRDLNKPPTVPHTSVELTDGTTLAVSKYTLKKRELELTLLAGPVLKLPTSMVGNILHNAQSENYRRDWKSRVYNARGKEAVSLLKKDDENREIIDTLECTLGEGDETGTAITIAVNIEGETVTRTRKLAGLHGIIFKNVHDSKVPTVAKLLDTQQDVVIVSSVTSRDGGLTVTTPAGAKIDFSNEQISRLDYTKGRQEYLSDLGYAKLVAKSNLDEGDSNPWFVFKDSNLNKGPLTLGGTVYPKGLAVKPETELVFDLKGEYREFEVVVGIDDNVSALGSSTLIIERDGKELARVTVSADDKKRFKPVTVNVKDAQRLRLVVKSDDDFDTSKHLDLADAKLRKE